MFLFAVRRLLQSIPVFMGIILISFCLLKAAGDPIHLLAHQGATLEEREALRRQLGLDRPWYEQLGRYFVLDLGKSYRQRRSVTDIVLRGAAVTGRLTLGAMVFAVAFGLIAGVVSAYRPRSWFDYASAIVASLGVSIPAFFLAMILVLIFSVRLDWLPLPAPNPDKLEYLIIPVMTLGLISTALVARLTRGCLLEQLTQDYVRTGRAKGVTRLKALLGHAFPNAMIPIVTVIGTSLASLLTGAVLTETVCALPGLGRTVFDAIGQRDIPVIMGGCMFFALIFVIVNLVVDILYGLMDARTREA